MKDKNYLNIRICPTKKQKLGWDKLLDKSTKFVLFGGGAGGGKAQPLDSNVLTPNGFKKMGDIQIGDVIVTPYNTHSKVIAIHPQGKQDIYEIKFSDKSVIKTTKEHLFECWISKRGQKSNKVRSVEEILKLKQKIIIPLSSNLEFGTHYSEVDSYLIGALLGDGGLTKSNITFTTADKEILDYLDVQDNKIVQTREYQYSIVANKRNKQGYPISPLMDKLKELGMMYVKTPNKRVPEVILKGSLKNRLECLQGLMDTDGTADSRGHPSFCSISKQLALDVQYLARSIGCKATFSQTTKFCIYKGQRKECTAYNVHIRSNNDKQLFKLSRKQNRCKQFNGGYSKLGRRIVSITKCGQEEAQCITISDSRGLYVSDDFIVTHNSWCGCEWCLYQCLKYNGIKLFLGRNELKRIMGSTYITWLKVCKHHKIPKEIWKLNRQGNFIEFINFETGFFDEQGSRIDLIDVARQPSDPLYERFGSMEFTNGWLEEIGEIPEAAFDVLKSRIGRHKVAGYDLPSKMFLTCNPKKNWGYYYGYKLWKEGNLPKDWCFIQSLYSDNPHTRDEYEQNLNSIRDPVLRQRLKDGNWEYESDEGNLFEYPKLVDMFSKTLTEEMNGEMFISVDVARGGRDKAVIILWQGFFVKKIWYYAKSKMPFLEDKIKSKMQQHQVDASHVIIDEDGIGGGVVDHIFGSKGFVNGSRAVEEVYEDTQETDKYSYKNLRSQCYFKLAEYVNAGKIGVYDEIPPELRNSILEELEVVKRKDVENNEKKLQVISKDDIKQTLLRSPDFADAMMMRMYFCLGMQEVTEIALAW